jgi:hypothetical protein
MKNRATAAERATLFKRGPNYLYVGESGFLVHICHRKYDGNGHFAGYAAMNYQWQWSEVGRLAFVYHTSGAVGGHVNGGYPVLFAWPAPGHVPVRDDNESQKGPDPSLAFRWDGWHIRAKTWLTGIRRSRHGEWLLLELRLWSGLNWRSPGTPDYRCPRDIAWVVCGAPLFRRRRWRKIARAVREYSPGHIELDLSATDRHALATARRLSGLAQHQ